MKNLFYVLVICLGIVSCAVSSRDDVTVGTEGESAVTASEPDVAAPETMVQSDVLTSFDDGKQTNACQRQPDGACIDHFLTHTCNFICCSGAQRDVQAVCGECNARAASWCGSGVFRTWWSF